MEEATLKEKLILDLFAVNAIKFGNFKLKSGIMSPYYFDLRVIISYPYILELCSEVFWEQMRLLDFDVIVGVPYTAIPIATVIGVKHNQSMIFVRKEAKDYGTKKLIEGKFRKGQKAIVIDDVITNGDSKLITIKPLEEEGLVVEDIIVLLNRGQGGDKILQKKGYTCHSILMVDEIFKTLLKYKRASKEVIDECKQFTKDSLKGAKKNDPYWPSLKK